MSCQHRPHMSEPGNCDVCVGDAYRSLDARQTVALESIADSLRIIVQSAVREAAEDVQ